MARHVAELYRGAKCEFKAMPYLPIVLIAVFAVFFYRAAEFENEPSLLWCGLSLALSAISLFYFHWGVLGILLGQIGLFAGITIARLMRKP